MPLVFQPCDINGNPLGATLDTASLTDIEWVLNGHGGGRLSVPFAAAGELVSVTGEVRNELQVMSNGSLIHWLNPLNARLVNGHWDIQLAGVSEHLEHRFVGNIVKDPFLANNDFDLGDLSSWSTVDCTSEASDTQSMGGGYSARLTAPTGSGIPATGLDSYIWQQFTSEANGVGTAWYAVAWLYIEDWTNYALNKRGLTISRIGAGPVLEDFQVARVDGYDERGKWIRIKTPEVSVPPDVEEIIEIRCYCPDAIVYWDRVYAIRQTSRSHPRSTAGEIIFDLVGHAQEIAEGKDDLNLAADGDTTAVFDRIYYYSDHQQIWAAIKELVGQTDGPDVRLELTPTTRTIAVHEPRLSAGASFATLRGGRDSGGAARTVEIAAYDLGVNWARRVTAAVALGTEGSGYDREEGGYIDTTAAAPISEAVIPANEETISGDLDRWAQGQLQQQVSSLTLKVKPTVDVNLLDGLELGTFAVGDVVTVDLRDETGATMIDGDWQTISIKLLADSTLALTLNPVPVVA